MCKANQLILATGYDTDLFTSRQFGQKSITYNIVTQPLEEIIGWHNESLIRDNEETYHYLRTTPDKRIIIGGADTPYQEAPITETKAKEKYEALLTHLQGMFPRISPIIMYSKSDDNDYGGTYSDLNKALMHILVVY